MGFPQILPSGGQGGAPRERRGLRSVPRVTRVPSAHLPFRFSAPSSSPRPSFRGALPPPSVHILLAFQLGLVSDPYLTSLSSLRVSGLPAAKYFKKHSKPDVVAQACKSSDWVSKAGEDLPRVQGQPELHNEKSKQMRSPREFMNPAAC